MALVERAALLRARGQLIEGLAILEQGRAVLPAGVVSPLYHRADALEAIIRVDIGEPEHALALARALPPTPRRRLIEATAWLSLGQTERADETTASIDLPDQDIRLALELSVIRAEVQRQRGPPDHAGLQHIIEIARVQDFLRTVLDGPSGLLSDLVTLLVRSPRDDYTDSLLAAAQRVQARRVCRARSGRRRPERAGAGSSALPADPPHDQGDHGRALYLHEHAQIPPQEHQSQTRCVLAVRRRRPRQDSRTALSLHPARLHYLSSQRRPLQSPPKG